MVWGFIRVGIFFGAFVIGLMLIGQLMPSVISNPLHMARLTEGTGASLLVVCETGDMLVRRVETERGAVQLECAHSKIMVVRDHNKRGRAYYRLLGL